jgi:hypothetical protein
MSFRASLVLLVGLLTAAPALATPTFVVQYGTDPEALSSWTPAVLGEIENPDGTTSFVGSSPFAGGSLQAQWNVTTDEDPFVDGVFAITNNTAFTQTFILSFSVPIAPALLTATGGASAIGTLTVNGNGGTLDHDGTDSMFTATVDGADFMTLLDDDSSVSALFGSIGTGPDSFGLPGLTTPVPGGASTDIGIRLAFTLTDGDSASFTSRFEVIPEPTTGLLLGLGLVSLALARRKAR